MADNFYKEMLKESRETNALMRQILAALNENTRAVKEGKDK